MIRPTDARPSTEDPALRGYRIVYREREKNFCPGCGGTHWWVGRMTAECHACGTAIPFAEVVVSGIARHIQCGTSETRFEIL